jgi:hypothetical protein
MTKTETLEQQIAEYVGLMALHTEGVKQTNKQSVRQALIRTRTELGQAATDIFSMFQVYRHAVYMEDADFIASREPVLIERTGTVSTWNKLYEFASEHNTNLVQQLESKFTEMSSHFQYDDLIDLWKKSAKEYKTESNDPQFFDAVSSAIKAKIRNLNYESITTVEKMLKASYELGDQGKDVRDYIMSEIIVKPPTRSFSIKDLLESVSPIFENNGTKHYQGIIKFALKYTTQDTDKSHEIEKLLEVHKLFGLKLNNDYENELFNPIRQKLIDSLEPNPSPTEYNDSFGWAVGRQDQKLMDQIYASAQTHLSTKFTFKDKTIGGELAIFNKRTEKLRYLNTDPE